ncbi:MAG: hypothetical protein UU47_C0004G0027 [candidate division TM6 bacterium GW2011_GWE2_41_16]|nr:MAG: hypothetical protein UU47_C0004G0027 [candidate division TM6 bacterium GW2011_GWE2_41_16]
MKILKKITLIVLCALISQSSAMHAISLVQTSKAIARPVVHACARVGHRIKIATPRVMFIGLAVTSVVLYFKYTRAQELLKREKIKQAAPLKTTAQQPAPTQPEELQEELKKLRKKAAEDKFFHDARQEILTKLSKENIKLKDKIIKLEQELQKN